MTTPLELVDRLRGRRVLVVGDLILDRYVQGEVPRISPEAPVPVLQVNREELRAGGAANVAANLAGLGADARLVGVIGRDDAGQALREAIAGSGVGVSGIRVDPRRPTVEKTRLLARHQQMLRFDREQAEPLGQAIEDKVLKTLARFEGRVDAVVLSDYGKGVLTQAVIAKACALGAEVLVDPKGSDYSRYRGSHLVTPNAAEAREASGIDTKDLEGCRRAARVLMERGGFRAVVITRGAEGIYFVQGDGDEGDAPTVARGVFDVTGAGDTVIATMALARAAEIPLQWAVTLANAAAGLVVERLGACTVSREQLAAALRGSSSTEKKCVELEAAAALTARQRALGRRVVLTNGCFDLLHAGHVESLEFARSQGDFLVVAVNGDASVRRQKGPSRPVQPLDARKRTLAGLASVDLVVSFDEDTPEKVIEELVPHVLVKGEDWAGRGVVGREFVEQHGGRVVMAPLFGSLSTTKLIEEIVRRQRPTEGRRRSKRNARGNSR